MQLRISLISILFLSMINIESIFVKQQFQIFVRTVASTFHNNWRRHFLSEHPHVKNRFKLTDHGNDYKSSDFIYPMILTVGSCLVHRNLKIARNRYNSSVTYVDILNMNYDELPDDWAHENRATARVACLLVLRSATRNRVFNRNLIEKFSRIIHNAWSKRNRHRTINALLLPYENLPDIEKDKDRRAILIACRLFNQLHFYQHFQTNSIRLIDGYRE